jgi:hypothetical protein
VVTSALSLANLCCGEFVERQEIVSVTVTHLSTVFVAGGGVFVTVSVSVIVS